LREFISFSLDYVGSRVFDGSSFDWRLWTEQSWYGDSGQSVSISCSRFLDLLLGWESFLDFLVFGLFLSLVWF